MRTKTLAIPFGVLLAGGALAPALASSQSTSGVSFELESGYIHETKPGIEELDQTAGNSDGAVLVKGGVDGNWQVSERLSLNAGYELQSRDYRQTDEFDTLTQLGHLGAQYTLAGHDVAASYHHARAELEGEGFLTLGQKTLSAGRLLGERWYGRLAVAEQRKTFASLPHRDGDNRSVGGDLFYFVAPTHFWRASLTGLSEQARAEPFDYRGWRMGLQWSREFALGSLAPSLEAGWQLEQRRYGAQGTLTGQEWAALPVLDGPGVSPVVAGDRDDRIDQVRLAVRLPLNRVFSVAGEVEHANHRSTVETRDYDRTRVSLTARMRF